MNLIEKYKPSESCTCEICRGYCQRPGWWTVSEAEQAIFSGFANRMMLEVSPEREVYVISPAFKGNECNFAFQIYSRNGCTFLKDGLCEIFDTGLSPLECRFCHHNRKGKGLQCHLDIEKDWNTESGRLLVYRWGKLVRLW